NKTLCGIGDPCLQSTTHNLYSLGKKEQNPRKGEKARSTFSTLPFRLRVMEKDAGRVNIRPPPLKMLVEDATHSPILTLPHSSLYTEVLLLLSYFWHFVLKTFPSSQQCGSSFKLIELEDKLKLWKLCS
ncbi:hypothetical protein Lal_00001208, partial [Lupinus albus]